MVMSSYKGRLNYKHISQSTQEILQYIKDRKEGRSKSLKTRWDKLNNQCMGGIEPNTIYTVAGISGSGKSSLANSLESDLFDLNPNLNFVVLSFQFEMLGSKQVGRKLSYKMEKTTSDLYSTKTPLSDEEYQIAEEITKNITDKPIYYVDVVGDVDEVRNTVLHFMENEGKNKWIIIILDHILLTKGKTGEGEREKISNLQYMFMELKKYGKNTIIQLSQMNRDIESTERISNESMHYPMRKDLFGSESIYQASDYILVLHRPELLQISSYGPRHWPVINLVYMHILKNREGELGILLFKNNLKYNRLDETTFEEYKGTGSSLEEEADDPFSFQMNSD